jgi:hypothetical protein
VIDFRARARERAGARWLRLSETEGRAEVRAEKCQWMAEHLGELERDQAYGSWRGAQPAAVHDAALGATRARLFRAGGPWTGSWIRRGARSRWRSWPHGRPEAFRRAGLDPAAFKDDGRQR